MDRRNVSITLGAMIIAFLLGFVPELIAKRNCTRELAPAQRDLRLARLEGRLGAALSESLRSNYERSRQIMAEYFSGLQGAMGQVTDPRERQALAAILGQRDEMITLLSRAQPESTQRLMLLYTQMFAAVDPAGTVAPAVTLPPPPPAPTTAPTPAPRPVAPAGAHK